MGKHTLDLTQEYDNGECSYEQIIKLYSNISEQLNSYIEQTQNTMNKLAEAFKSICTIQYSGILSKMDYLTDISVPISNDVKLKELAERIKVLEDIIKSNK